VAQKSKLITLQQLTFFSHPDIYCAIKVVTCDSDKVNLGQVRFLRK